MGFNKLGDSCEPYVEDGGLPEDCQTEAMRALFVIGYAKFPDKWINKAEIYEIIETNAETEAFSWFFDLAEKGSKTRVGKDLRQFKERELEITPTRVSSTAFSSPSGRAPDSMCLAICLDASYPAQAIQIPTPQTPRMGTLGTSGTL